MGIETIALGALAGATALSAVGSIQQGQQQRRLAEAQAEQMDLQAAQERDAAIAQAERIRRAGRAQQSAATAAYAASGVSVGEGTPVRVNEQIGLDTETDAYMAILEGNRRSNSLRTEAGFTRQAGANAQRSGFLGAGTSVLGGAAKYGMWRASQKD